MDFSYKTFPPFYTYVHAQPTEHFSFLHSSKQKNAETWQKQRSIWVEIILETPGVYTNQHPIFTHQKWRLDAGTVEELFAYMHSHGRADCHDGKLTVFGCMVEELQTNLLDYGKGSSGVVTLYELAQHFNLDEALLLRKCRELEKKGMVTIIAGENVGLKF